MDWQDGFNIVAGILGTIGGFMLYAMWDTVKDLRTKLGAMEVLVAGRYITREEHTKSQDAVFEFLRGMKTEQRETNRQLFDKLDEIAKDVATHKGSHH